MSISLVFYIEKYIQSIELMHLPPPIVMMFLKRGELNANF